ncbi:MAG: beta-lactamase family protein [Chloroflexi bacterium]|nr:beta-lactamase family protein [Chloroflexota bacterium]
MASCVTPISTPIPSAPAPPPTGASSAYWPTADWRTSTPEEQGLDSVKLADMLEAIRKQGHDIDSVSVVRHGYLVADATVYPFQPDTKHVVHSCTKSVISALVGIAIDQGHIQGVDQPVLDIFANRTVANVDERKQAMTLEHVLMMANGLECRDSYLYRWQGMTQMRGTDDWIQFMLDLPMAEAPGTRFEYCNGGSFLLSAIVQEKTGQTALDFARENLFGPLGITDVDWPANPQGITIGWGDLRLKPHDMLKFGYLYLHEGQWAGRQVVPAVWVRASTTRHIAAGTLSDGYGYQWWVDDAGYTMALGYAGQYIVVVPDQDMVVVFTSDLAEQDFFTPETLLKTYILPAAVSDGPLPANSDGVALLEARAKALAVPRNPDPGSSE